MIVPKAYLGWQGDLQKDNHGREYAGEGFADGAGAYTIANDTILEAHRVKNAEAIITGLRKMYFEGRPGSLCSLQYLVDGAIGLHHRIYKSDKR